MSIKMRTFGACGGVRTHPVHPPWLRAWTCQNVWTTWTENSNFETNLLAYEAKQLDENTKMPLQFINWLLLLFYFL